MPPDKPVLSNSILDTLQRDFIVIGNKRVRSLHAWSAIGLVLLGALAGIILVANRTGQLTTTRAAGTVIVATSCNQTDVQNAIDQAQDGDVVQIPAGTCTWTTVTALTPSVSMTKAVTLMGAGIDKTIINDGTGAGAWESPVSITSGARVTGFTFTDMRTVTDYKEEVLTNGTNWRVDHNTFILGDSGMNGVTAQGIGVIDHNTFQDVINGTIHGIEIFGNSTIGSVAANDPSWDAPSSLGTANNVFIEDNIFNFTYPQDGAYDSYDGARYVFRYNTVNGTEIGGHGFDSGPFRSPFSWEIYNNTFTNPNSHIFTAILIRGGSGVIFNNTVSSSGGSYDSFAILRNYRSDSGYLAADGNNWGTCDGTNAYDGNTPGGQGYPCRDQIGRGTNQTLNPTYLWNNNFKGSTTVYAQIAAFNDPTRAQQYHIIENRDYFNNTPKPGYTPYVYPHPLVSGTAPSPTPDTTPPSVPTGLVASVVSSSQINLSWSASTDNVGVTGYKVFRNGTQVGTVSVTNFSNTGLSAGTTYSYTVAAYDAAGNTSSQSAPVSATTLAPTPVPSTNKFIIGDRVQTTNKLNVRLNPGGGKLLGQQAKGARGTITLGPQTANNNTWYKIDYDTGADGWSVQDYLVKIL